MMKLELLDDEIGRKLAESHASGELQSAAGYGKPLQGDAGWDQTPEALRMPFKILKNAGLVPYEVEMLNQRAALRTAIEAATDPAERKSLVAKLGSLEQNISLRLESMARNT